MNDVTQTEEEIKEALKDIPTISIVAAFTNSANWLEEKWKNIF